MKENDAFEVTMSRFDFVVVNNETMLTNSIGGVSTLLIVYSTGMVVVPGPDSDFAASLRPNLRFMARKNIASRLLRI